MTGRRLALILAGVVVAWIGVVGVQTALAYRDLRAGELHAEAIRDDLGPSDLLSGRPAERLARAEARFGAARRRLDGWPLAPVRLLPIIGRQLRSAHALAAAAEHVAAAGADGVRDAADAVRAPRDSGPDRVALVRRLRAIASRGRSRLAAVDLGPDRALLVPLADRRAAFAEDVARARAAARRAEGALDAVADLLAGPRRYLLVAGHNAEMRAGFGSILSVGVIEAADGDLALSEMEPAFELLLEPGVAPDLPPDMERLWGWMSPNREWRNLGVTPRFPATAALAAEMWQARTGEAVDGVIGVDIAALEAVVGAAGPVEAAGIVLGPDEVARYLLRGQYQRFEGELDARRDHLSLIAGAAVDVIERGKWDAAELASRLAGAAAGRHLLVWSRHAGAQRGWTAAGVDGAVPADSVAISVLNRGANKLDQFLHVDAELRLARPVEIRVTLDNRTPDGLPRYVAGPYPGSGVDGYGDYIGILSVTLPGAARDARFEPRRPVAAAGPDGRARVIATEVVVPRGESVELVLRFRLDGVDAIRVLPSARLPAVRWEAEGRSWRDSRGVTIPVGQRG